MGEFSESITGNHQTPIELPVGTNNPVFHNPKKGESVYPDAADQLPLLNLKDIVTVPGNGRSIQERFEEFHKNNPHVFEILKTITLYAYNQGVKVGMKAVYEQARWQYRFRTKGDGSYRLDNNYHSRYARLLMEQVPELVDYFEQRKLRS